MTTMECSSRKLHAITLLIASSLAHCFFCMVMDSGGVFHVLFLEAFGGGSGDTAFILSLNTATFYAAGPLSAYLIQRLGFKATTIIGAVLGSVGVTSCAFVNSLPMAYFTFGFLGGFGLGIAYIPSISIVGFYFTDCRPVAFAIASSGCGIGKLFAPYILLYCEEKYGWRGAMSILGAIALNIAVCASIYREPKKESSCNDAKDEISTSPLKSSDTNKGLCKDLSMLKDINFLLYCANNVLFCVGYAAAMVHLPAYAQTLGINEKHTSIFFSIFGPASIVGKISFGLIGQIKGVKHILVYMIIFFILGSELLFAPLYLITFTDFLIFSITFGFMMSTFGATLPSILVELYDVASLSSAYGYIQLFQMVGFMLGPPMAGWLYDWTSYYPASIYFGGASIMISSLIIIPAWLSVECQKPKRNTSTSDTLVEVRLTQLPDNGKEANASLFSEDEASRQPSHSPGVAV